VFESPPDRCQGRGDPQMPSGRRGGIRVVRIDHVQPTRHPELCRFHLSGPSWVFTRRSPPCRPPYHTGVSFGAQVHGHCSARRLILLRGRVAERAVGSSRTLVDDRPLLVHRDHFLRARPSRQSWENGRRSTGSRAPPRVWQSRSTLAPGILCRPGHRLPPGENPRAAEMFRRPCDGLSREGQCRRAPRGSFTHSSRSCTPHGRIAAGGEEC